MSAGAASRAALRQRAAELQKEAAQLQAEAAGKRREAEALLWQARQDELLQAQPQAGGRALALRLLEGNLLLTVVDLLENARDRLALAASCKVLWEYSRHNLNLWLGSGQAMTLCCTVASIQAAHQLTAWLSGLKLSSTSSIRVAPLFKKMALQLDSLPWPGQEGRHAVVNLLSAVCGPAPVQHRLQQLHLEAPAVGGASGVAFALRWPGLLPALRSLRLRFTGGGVVGGFSHVCCRLPQLQCAGLEGLHVELADNSNSSRFPGLMELVCGASLTRLSIQSSDLSNVPANFMAPATQLQHLALRNVQLPAGFRPNVLPQLVQLKALEVAPAQGSEQLGPLAGLTSLRQLAVEGADCEAAVASLPPDLTHLELLQLPHDFPPDQLRTLTGLTGLLQLTVSSAGSVLPAGTVSMLQGLTSVTSLTLP